MGCPHRTRVLLTSSRAGKEKASRRWRVGDRWRKCGPREVCARPPRIQSGVRGLKNVWGIGLGQEQNEVCRDRTTKQM